MSETQILAALERIEQKIQVLETQYREAKGEIVRLEDEKKQLRKERQEAEERARALEGKLSISENSVANSQERVILVHNLSKIGTNADLKQRLDEYIRDLEQCIHHLSNLS